MTEIRIYIINVSILKLTWLILFFTLLHIPNLSFAQLITYPKENPVELGKVKWLRNYDDAVRASMDKKIPVFILFQEVPGCGNCTKFGNGILSHPLIVEAIETYFVPLCIYNNQKGHDKKVLEKFNEPSWNNPVIRVINQDGKDLVIRQTDFRSVAATVITLQKAISASGKEVPEYLKLLLEETEAREKGNKEEVYFSMYCFWTGEKEISGLPGIIGTEAGYMLGKEVVKVTYNSDKTSFSDIFTKSKKMGCADEVYGSISNDNNIVTKPAGAYKKDSEDKYYLSKSIYKVIPMTDLQKTKVNRALGTDQDPKCFLSFRQLSLINDPKINKSQIAQNIEKVWWKM